jgi:hypothetical protein
MTAVRGRLDCVCAEERWVSWLLSDTEIFKFRTRSTWSQSIYITIPPLHERSNEQEKCQKARKKDTREFKKVLKKTNNR